MSSLSAPLTRRYMTLISFRPKLAGHFHLICTCTSFLVVYLFFQLHYLRFTVRPRFSNQYSCGLRTSDPKKRTKCRRSFSATLRLGDEFLYETFSVKPSISRCPVSLHLQCKTSCSRPASIGLGKYLVSHATILWLGPWARKDLAVLPVRAVGDAISAYIA